MSENELGLFLRSRREAVTPSQAGLPAGNRRRTPGLRRAELATLAGVSVEYVIRLEQGRDRRPSSPVLSALADALQLSPSERIHLHRLSKGADPGFHCMGGEQPKREVREAVRAILDHLEPAPAVVLNRLTEVLACTDGYRRLMAPLGLLDAPDWPNLARFVFTDPRARSAFPDWEHVADEVVAVLKHGPFRADPDVASLADELTIAAGADFARRVETVPGLAAATGIQRMHQPEVGEIRLSYEVLELSADDDQRLVVHLPADAAAEAALERLEGRRPGGLRAVRSR
ncbi:helix-turn-helix domain-containing protein [Saccharopolyspora mangrovi]|uniref:Helix-turn-helix transcriptional regulator n=1 Tax=Saccharopolyspora mangrovi TaxID=3082379 RepID=A0ABU6ADM4_9PSEU|nr:helix-turn-helix transcriptional regulator [Saccharopolyspora sp. S2-29]MEB3369657.1 helix-turn-helix transcriptional regulator [Saccharopolyspora sp. S2-29]